MAWIKLNATTPAAPEGARNVHFREDPGHTGAQDDPRPVSAYLEDLSFGFTELLDAPASYEGQGGLVVAVKADESGLEFIEAGGGPGSAPVTIGFPIGVGTAGVNVGPMLSPSHGGEINRCKVVTKQSDPSVSLRFVIKQNGVSVFSATPTIAAGTASGHIDLITDLTSVPLDALTTDVFSIDIVEGSENWQFTAQLES